MSRDKKFTEDSKLEAFRLPSWLSSLAREKARAQDMNLSQLMRRALRNELGVGVQRDSQTDEQAA